MDHPAAFLNEHGQRTVESRPVEVPALTGADEEKVAGTDIRTSPGRGGSVVAELSLGFEDRRGIEILEQRLSGGRERLADPERRVVAPLNDSDAELRIAKERKGGCGARGPAADDRDVYTAHRHGFLSQSGIPLHSAISASSFRYHAGTKKLLGVL